VIHIPSIQINLPGTKFPEGFFLPGAGYQSAMRKQNALMAETLKVLTTKYCP
jgi:hypothetical protein